MYEPDRRLSIAKNQPLQAEIQFIARISPIVVLAKAGILSPQAKYFRR
jgi:hypothetical protein